MKLKFLLILFISNLTIKSFCQIRSTWIGKYHTAIENGKTDKFPLQKVIKFDKNELIEYYFNKDFLFSESKVDTSNIQFYESNIIVKQKNKIDTLEFRIDHGNLVLIDKTNDNLMVYEQLSRYEQSKNIFEFNKFINNNIFKIRGEESTVEFDVNHNLTLSNLDLYWGDNQYWILEEFENELFLIIDGYFGTVFHIKKYNSNDGFEGIIYAPENISYKLIKINSKEKYDTQYLIGKWERNSEMYPPPPFGSRADSLRYINKEILIFNDSMMINKHGFIVQSSKWKTNLSKELLLFPDLSKDVKRRQWNIKILTNNKLTIERKRRKWDFSKSSQFEIIEFNKIE